VNFVLPGDGDDVVLSIHVNPILPPIDQWYYSS
jgi:hypothetical protein